MKNGSFNFLEEKKKFDSLQEYKEFAAQLEENSAWKEVSVETPYSPIGGIYERWFTNSENNETWRLVEPDGPFRGVWEQVSK